MKRQDLPSYLAVLKFRGGKTILVEGPTDKRALARALLEFERSNRIARGAVLVDSADTIDLPGQGLGNRDVVLVAQGAARQAGFDVFALVDREFERFVATRAEFRDEIGAHHRAGDVVWTRGHSIENYFFEVEYAQEYLRYRYADRLSADAIDRLSIYWPAALANVAALSIAARNAGILNRLNGAFSLDVWDIAEGPGVISVVPAELERIAAARGVPAPDAASFRAEFELLLEVALRCSDAHCTRWVTHGHIGDEALWFAVARVLWNAGVERPLAQEVGCGYRDDKRYHRADRWAALHKNPAPPPTPQPLWDAVGVRR